jgi:hypothetical protein
MDIEKRPRIIRGNEQTRSDRKNTSGIAARTEPTIEEEMGSGNKVK